MKFLSSVRLMLAACALLSVAALVGCGGKTDDATTTPTSGTSTAKGAADGTTTPAGGAGTTAPMPSKPPMDPSK